jgi:hypothetical protein
MSQNVPGFSQLTNAVNKISPGLMNMAISGTVFQWGGLVRMVGDYSNSKGSVHLDLNLLEASKNLNLPASDFDVPSN